MFINKSSCMNSIKEKVNAKWKILQACHMISDTCACFDSLGLVDYAFLLVDIQTSEVSWQKFEEIQITEVM